MPFTSLLLFVLMWAVASAEMVFESQLLEIEVAPEQKEVELVFPFKIENGPTTIKSYTAGVLFKRVAVEPLKADRSVKLDWKDGESGQIVCVVDASYFQWSVDRSFEIILKDQKNPICLMARLRIPELIKLSPSSLRWTVGDDPKGKVIKITMHHDQPILLTKHLSQHVKDFPYTLKTIRKGWEYEIRMAPTHTKERRIGLIKLTTDCEFQRFKRISIFGVVRPKPKPAPEAEK